MRFARAPDDRYLPCSTRPLISAARVDITSARRFSEEAPEITRTSSAIANAVSRPSIPKEAPAHSVSFASLGCGAWSVAITSMVPSTNPDLSAKTSASVRSGGLTLNSGL